MKTFHRAGGRVVVALPYGLPRDVNAYESHDRGMRGLVREPRRDGRHFASGHRRRLAHRLVVPPRVFSRRSFGGSLGLGVGLAGLHSLERSPLVGQGLVAAALEGSRELGILEDLGPVACGRRGGTVRMEILFRGIGYPFSGDGGSAGGTRFHAAAIGGGSGLNRGGYSLAPCAFTPASSATDSEAVHAEEDLRFARLIFFLFCLAKEWNVT